MSEPLNPKLYQRLCATFGHVRIANEGIGFQATAMKDFLTKETKVNVEEPGENYRVSCPFCSDDRYRLYVGHMWGQPDESGRRMFFLATCFNEGCMKDPDNRRAFIERLLLGGGWLESARVRKGSDSRELRLAAWPGPVRRLDTLPDDHKAREYVRSRNFDPDRLGRYYGVSYCLDSIYYLARERLIIPVYDHGVLKGWQARYVGELPWNVKPKRKELPPKYYTMPRMRKAQLIGNFDNAKKYHTFVGVEGWFDVFGFGPCAGCVFGSTLSKMQIGMINGQFRKRSVVLLLDPEAIDSENVQKARAQFAHSLPGAFAVVRLPAGTDPGSLDREFQHDYVRSEARKQGVTVNFERLCVAGSTP